MICEIIKRNEFYEKNGCHPKDSIIIVLKGSFNCTISGNDYHAAENDIFVFEKNEKFKREVISPIECVYIQFDKFPVDLKSGIMKINDLIRKESSIAYLAEAVRNCDDSVARHFLKDIFILNNHPAINALSVNDEVVEKCIDFLKSNYGEFISLDMLAEKFGISKQWLIARFNECTGKSPMKYLSEIRVQNAKSLLINSALPVGLVAMQCGFENVYYFSNAFKKYTNVSPTCYRKNFRL